MEQIGFYVDGTSFAFWSFFFFLNSFTLRPAGKSNSSLNALHWQEVLHRPWAGAVYTLYKVISVWFPVWLQRWVTEDEFWVLYLLSVFAWDVREILHGRMMCVFSNLLLTEVSAVDFRCFPNVYLIFKAIMVSTREGYSLIPAASLRCGRSLSAENAEGSNSLIWPSSVLTCGAFADTFSHLLPSSLLSSCSASRRSSPRSAPWLERSYSCTCHVSVVCLRHMRNVKKTETDTMSLRGCVRAGNSRGHWEILSGFHGKERRLQSSWLPRVACQTHHILLS